MLTSFMDAPYEKSWQPQRILGDEKGQLHEFILTGWCQVASCHLQEVQFCDAKERDGLNYCIIPVLEFLMRLLEIASKIS